MRWFLRDWTWVRGAFIAACISAAYSIWFLVFRQPRPDSADIFTIGALSFGVASVAMGTLRWLADANPKISVLHENANPILDRSDRRLGILQLRVDLRDVPVYLRPLVHRDAPEACEIRLWYLKDDDCHEKLLDAEGLLGRWNDNDEPVDYASGQPELKVALRNRRLAKMVPLDTPYTVAFAIKAEGDADCYHWNDQSYMLPPEML